VLYLVIRGQKIFTNTCLKQKKKYNLKIAGELKLREDDRLMCTKIVTHERRFSFLDNEGHIQGQIA